MNRPRLSPELLSCERHSNHYGGGGVLSGICWPNGSISHVPQAATDLIVALMRARLEAK